MPPNEGATMDVVVQLAAHHVVESGGEQARSTGAALRVKIRVVADYAVN
jgi:hypothetical protein